MTRRRAASKARAATARSATTCMAAVPGWRPAAAAGGGQASAAPVLECSSQAIRSPAVPTSRARRTDRIASRRTRTGRRRGTLARHCARPATARASATTPTLVNSRRREATAPPIVAPVQRSQRRPASGRPERSRCSAGTSCTTAGPAPGTRASTASAAPGSRRTCARARPTPAALARSCPTSRRTRPAAPRSMSTAVRTEGPISAGSSCGQLPDSAVTASCGSELRA